MLSVTKGSRRITVESNLEKIFKALTAASLKAQGRVILILTRYKAKTRKKKIKLKPKQPQGMTISFFNSYSSF